MAWRAPPRQPGDNIVRWRRVFMLRRDEAKTHRQLVREELGETFDHALRAAGYATSGVDAKVRPRVAAAREYLSPTAGKVRERAVQGWGSTRSRFAPFTEAAQARVAKIKDAKSARRTGAKMSRRRWPVLIGLLASGAAVGALGALIMRRRRQQWEGYEADEAFESSEPAMPGASAVPAESPVTTGPADDGAAGTAAH
jgi:hypothetical protein